MNTTIRTIYNVNPIGFCVENTETKILFAVPSFKKFEIVVGKLIRVDAKITGITDALLSLIGILESFLPANVADDGLLEY